MEKLLAILMITPLLLMAQTDEKTHNIEWNTNLLFESNSLDKGFLNTMLYGGYISEVKKTKWINSGVENNILYSEISNRLSYTFEKNNSIIALTSLVYFSFQIVSGLKTKKFSSLLLLIKFKIPPPVSRIVFPSSTTSISIL